MPVGPAAPGIVEDIADAAMIFSASRLKPWGTAHIQRGALAAAIAVALLATGLAVTYRVATGGLSGLVAVSVVAAVIAVAGLLVTARAERAGTALSIAALVTDRRRAGVGGAGKIRAGAADAGRRRRHRVVAGRSDGAESGA